MTYQLVSNEQAAKWRERSSMVPFLRFRPSWQVAIIPPFAGADARFLVRKGNARVSVYLDFDGNLGCMGEPYWEVHPYDGDVARFPLNETDELLAAIAKSIRQQERRFK